MNKANASLIKVVIKQAMFCIMVGLSLGANLSLAEPAAAKPQEARASYEVQSGDVFGKVCQKFQPAGVPLKTVMHDVYVINKAAFKEGRQADLIVGSVLQIPPQYQGTGAQGTPKSEALVATPAPQAPQTESTATAPTEAKAVTAPASPQEAVITSAEEETSQPAPSLPTKALMKARAWLSHIPSSAIFIALLVVALGAYLRKRKLLIEAQRKAMEDLLLQRTTIAQAVGEVLSAGVDTPSTAGDSDSTKKGA